MSSRHSSCQRKGEIVSVLFVSALKDTFLYLEVKALQNGWRANEHY